MRKLKILICGLAAMFGVVTLGMAPVMAADEICSSLTGELAEVAGCGNTTTADTLAGKVINVLLYVVGILAVVMIIWAGLTMTTSAGDAAKATKAKNTMIYAVAGLVVAILAYAIVNFVVKKF